jgi:membrane protease YdiL (CAAX protease family)
MPLVTDRLNLAGWYHLLFFGAFLPLIAVLNRKRLLGTATALPNRLRHFQKTVFELAAFAALSLLVARVQWISLFPRSLPSPGAALAGLAMYVAAVLYMRPNWRRAVERRARVVHLFMPSNAVERAWWLAVSVLAGISEEITWRGVQIALTAVLTGGFWTAALLSSLSFAMVHIVQGWKSAAIIVLFGLGFSALVWLSGSLYVAMAVHIAYDITAGITYGRLGRELAPEGLDSAPGSHPHCSPPRQGPE